VFCGRIWPKIAYFCKNSLFFSLLAGNLTCRDRFGQHCVVSHAVPEIGDFAMTGAEARIPRAFADAEIGDRLEWVS
jgi:hypothetical protein